MVNFCAVLGCSNLSNREKDKGYCRIAAIVSRSKPKKQALSVERRANWFARIRWEDLAVDATEFYRVCGDHFISGMPITWCKAQFTRYIVRFLLLFRLVLKHGMPECWNAGTPERRNTKTRNTKLLKRGTHEK